jgi:septum site-determining protein MinD
MTTEKGRLIAIMSGKGGSGKTMATAVMAEILPPPVVIVDADTGTAGMTFYLGLDLLPNTREGLTTLAQRSLRSEPIPNIERVLKPIPSQEGVRFLSIGDPRRLFRDMNEKRMTATIRQALEKLASLPGWTLVDCRGGIDRESLAVCRIVDEIILIVEPNTTSFQATQHVVDILARQDLDAKLRGFFINKVFDDPTITGREGTAAFGCQFLSAIPLDLAATRDFLVGAVPSKTTLFGTHIWDGLCKAYPHSVLPPLRPPWKSSEYREVNLLGVDSMRGGYLVAGGIALASFEFYLLRDSRFYASGAPLMILAVLGMLGGIDSMRRKIGELLASYRRVAKRTLMRLERTVAPGVPDAGLRADAPPRRSNIRKS